MSVIPQKKLFADEPKSGKGTKRSLEESEDVGEEDASETDKKKSAKEQQHAPPSEQDETKTATPTATTSLPARPIKKARTAYFIFADDKRAEIQAKVSLRKGTPTLSQNHSCCSSYCCLVEPWCWCCGDCSCHGSNVVCSFG